MYSTRMAGTNGHIHPESLYLWNELFPFPGGLARLRFLCSRLLPWFLFGRQFAPALRGPACFISLTAARDSQGIRWDVFGDRGTRRDIRPIADSNRRNQRGIASDKNFVADVRRKFVEAVVVAGNRTSADVCFRADLRIAEIGEVHRLGAFADSALLQLDEISDARIRFQVIVRAKTREGTDDDAVVKATLRYYAMRLDGYVVAKSCVGENASRSNGATHANFRFAEQLHAGLDDGVFARDDIGIDQDCFRQLNRHAGVHEGAALPFAKNAVDFGKVRTCVAAENFARIRGHVSVNGFALRIQNSDRVSQVEFAMFVIWPYLGERRPEFLQREAVNRRIDFVDLALLVTKL